MPNHNMPNHNMRHLYTICVLAFAVAIVLHPAPVRADDGNMGELTGNSTVVMPGEEQEEIPEIIKFILPASEAFDFVLDPQGLSKLKEGEGAALDELDSGKVFSKIDIPAIVLNEGSVPMKLTIEFTATTSAGGGGNDDEATFIENATGIDEAKAAVFDGDGRNILLYIVPSEPGITSAHDEFSPADFGFIITEAPAVLTFYFPGAEYVMSGDGDDARPEPVPGTGSGTQLTIGGFINSNANWVNFTQNHRGSAPSSITLTAVFTWHVIDDEQDGESEPPQDLGIMHFLEDAGSRQAPAMVTLDEDALNTLLSGPADVEKTYLPVG